MLYKCFVFTGCRPNVSCLLVVLWYAGELVVLGLCCYYACTCTVNDAGPASEQLCLNAWCLIQVDPLDEIGAATIPGAVKQSRHIETMLASCWASVADGLRGSGVSCVLDCWGRGLHGSGVSSFLDCWGGGSARFWCLVFSGLLGRGLRGSVVSCFLDCWGCLRGSDVSCFLDC